MFTHIAEEESMTFSNLKTELSIAELDNLCDQFLKRQSELEKELSRGMNTGGKRQPISEKTESAKTQLAG